MKIKQRVNAAALLAAASLTFVPTAWSLGLGDVTVESFLNQPLQVKIDLISRETDDMSSVTASLASAADYQLIGASLESIPVPIYFSVEDKDGDAFILATSSLPISQPVLRLIVEVNWSSGRQLREYTIFLDPVTYAEPAPLPRVDKRAVPAPAVSQAQPQDAAPSARPDAAATATASSPTTVREPVDGEYGPVASGETLWGIASNWSRGTGLNMNQVMIAIQRENPDAFLQDNINLLKRGAILRMPRIEDVRAISTEVAFSEVREQQAALNSRSPAASAASPSTPLLAEQSALAEAAEVQQAIEEAVLEDEVMEAEAIVEATAESGPEPAPLLELVPPSQESQLDSTYGFEESEDGNTDASVGVSSLREELARTEEDLITQQQQNEYLAERIKELEAQLASAEEGNVKDANLANMEDRLRQERLAEEAAARKKSEPWYSSVVTWLVGFLILAAAGAGWWFSRRRIADEFLLDTEEQQLREIKDEAEEVLRVLKEPDAPVAPIDKAKDKADEAKSGPGATEKSKGGNKAFRAGEGNARVLDEESSDPEIQLDLARAYISMGDKEAARVILEEVGNSGTEEQRQEANKMLKLLAP